MGLVKLHRHYWPLLHRIMILQNFPQVPDNFDYACEYLEQVEIYGILKNGQLTAAFLFGDITADSAFIDVVCAPSQHGKWASRRILCLLANLVFKEMKLNFVWAEVAGRKALITALKAGFVPIEQIEINGTVMVLSNHAFDLKFNSKNQKKEKKDGFFIQNKGGNTTTTATTSIY